LKTAKKKFDCVEMKREIQTRLYEKTKDMNSEQERKYYREKAETGSFSDLWKKIINKQTKKAS